MGKRRKKGKMCFLLGTFWYILAYFWLFFPHFLKMWQNVWLFFIDKCALSLICTSVHLFIVYFSKEQKSVMCDVWMGNCPTLSREKKGGGGKEEKIWKNDSVKETVLQDWGGLLMVETDKTHLFNGAEARLFLNLTTFL